MLIFSYPSVLTYVLGAQKNRPIETVLLSTHNSCIGELLTLYKQPISNSNTDHLLSQWLNSVIYWLINH